MSTHRLSHPDLEYIPTQQETVESTLAFILIDLEDLDRRNVLFTLSQEDQLYAIENAARALRKKLS